MMDVDEAQRIVLARGRPLPVERMPLGDALDRTLAEPVRCDLDYPPFDRAVMDGFAVRSADVSSAPVILRVVGQIAAGSAAARPLGPGEAMQINTGAPIPTGANAVVRVEDTETQGFDDRVLIRTAANPAQFITPRGDYVRAGDPVLEAGDRLTPLAIGAAASAGAATVLVYRQPRVAVLSTGDELVDIAHTPSGAQIRNSNEYLLDALIRAAHAAPQRLGVARDEPSGLRERIRMGLSADVLCITGGVSMGAFDFVPKVLEELGAAFHVHKMAIKPGRPTVFATMPDGTLVFALPGNPASALVGFELLIRPALAVLEGRPGRVSALIVATLRGAIAATGHRRTYLPARIRAADNGEWEAEPLSWRGSGDSFGMARADALIMRPPRSDEAGDGQTVAVLPLDRA